MITNNELIRVISFLSGRFPNVSDEWLAEHRDSVIADTFEFIENQRKYQYDNKGLKANCLYCGKDYNEHTKIDLECPR